MTTITQVGTIGSYSFNFVTGAIGAKAFIENFFAGNLKQATITENHIHLISKQGEEVTVDLCEFELDSVEHLDEQNEETFEMTGM